MNIGWIFLICALLVLLVMAIAPWLRKEQKVGNKRLSAQPDELDAKLKRNGEVMRFIRAGQINSAIEIYREDTGASLAYAEAAIARMELSLRPLREQPERQSITKDFGT